MSKREEQFEAMLNDILTQHKDVSSKIDTLKAEGKEKSVTFKQLLASKLSLISPFTTKLNQEIIHK